MSDVIVKRFRLFPTLIGVAIIAFSMRVADIVTGYNLMTQTVIAAEAMQQDTDDTDADTQDTAQAEDDETGGAATATQPAGNTPPLRIGVPSSEELELLTQLRQRREELDQRAVQLDLQEQLLAGTEKRINDKIQQLSALEEKVKEHLRLFDQRETEQLKAIVAVYEKMKAKDAAPRFETLDLQTQMDLVSLMKATKVADLMAKMSPKAATELTKELATVAQPPTIDEVGGAQ